MKLKFQQKEMIEEEQLMIATNDLEIAVKRVVSFMFFFLFLIHI